MTDFTPQEAMAVGEPGGHSARQHRFAWTGNVRIAVLVWWSMLPIGLLLAIVLPGVLPEHYMFDAAMIRDFIVGEERPRAFEPFASYANTAYLYIVAGVEARPVAGAIFTYVVAWLSVLVAVLLANSGGRFWLWYPAFVWHFLLVVYTCMHTKELHAIPTIALLLLLCGRQLSWWRLIAMGGVIAAYALYFRTYWAVVALLAFAFMFLRRRITSPWHLAGFMVAAYLLLFAGYHLATGKFLTDVRATLAVGREFDLFSDTAFANIFDNENLFDDIGNAVWAFVCLMVPLPLLATGKPEHLIFTAWEILMVALFAVLFARVWSRRDIDARTEFCAAWILAFSLIQGVFEPDYGTFLRHQTNLLPALALLAVNAIWRTENTGAPDRRRDARD